MITRDQVLALVQTKGPVIPSDISSELRENTIIIGAFLSELVAAKLVKVTKAKIGGSPVYYLDSQRNGLKKIYPFMNEKDRRTYDLLSTGVVLFDDTQTPLVQTSLRQLPDFAVPLKVTYKGTDHLFWKWHLANDSDATAAFKRIIKELYPEPVAPVIPTIIKTVKEVAKKSEPVLKEEVTNVESKDEPVPIPVKEGVLEKQTSLSKEKKSSKVEIVDPSPKEESILPDDEFFLTVKTYFDTKEIKVHTCTVIKKKSELDLQISFKTPVGDIRYYCKARNKKKSNEGDIASAFVEGQLFGLPTAYISTGDVPQKVYDLLDTKYKNLKVLTL